MAASKRTSRRNERLIPKIEPARLVAGIFAMIIICALIAGGLGTAITDFGFLGGAREQVIEVDEEVADAQLGEFEQALRDQIAADPDNAEAMRHLANLLATKRDPDEAIDWYEQSLTIAPDDARTRLDFGKTLAELGRQADAELQFQRAVALLPTDVEPAFELARLYQQWEPPRTAEAIAGYQQVVATAPESFYGEQAAKELVTLGVAVAAPAAATPRGA